MSAFEEEGKNTNRPRLMLTAAVSAGKATIDSAYQIAQLGASVHEQKHANITHPYICFTDDSHYYNINPHVCLPVCWTTSTS